MLNEICFIPDIFNLLISPWVIFLIILLVVVIYCIWLIRYISKNHKDAIPKWLTLMGITSLTFFTIGTGIVLVFGLILGLAIYDEIYNQPIAAKYFDLNAAIKNTCYLDPQRNHCPKNLDELIAIEPQKFNPLTFGKGLTYDYYPASNEYTLVVRDQFHKGVIFDPRLAKEGYGFDFLDVRINSCFGGYFVRGSLFNEEPWKSAFENYIKSTNFNRKIN